MVLMLDVSIENNFVAGTIAIFPCCGKIRKAFMPHFRGENQNFRGGSYNVTCYGCGKHQYSGRCF